MKPPYDRIMWEMPPLWYFFVGSHGGEKFNSALLCNRWVVELSRLYQSRNNRGMQMLKQIPWYLEIRFCACANCRMRRKCTCDAPNKTFYLGDVEVWWRRVMVFSWCHKSMSTMAAKLSPMISESFDR